LESANYEDAVRKAISLGGDADTLYKKIPRQIVRQARHMLGKELLAIIDEFINRYS